MFAGSLVRPLGGALADRFGGVRALTVLYAVAACAFADHCHRPVRRSGSRWRCSCVGMLALGMGNGAVFQLVPQRFRNEIGVMTGLVGMTGGVGGFYLASSLGYSKQLTGSYGAGFLRLRRARRAGPGRHHRRSAAAGAPTWAELYGAARV